MEKELVIKKCSKCNTLIEVIKDCNCDNCSIKCCGEEMIELVPNSVDAAFEKHVPNYEVIDNRIIVTVNHVMEEDRSPDGLINIGVISVPLTSPISSNLLFIPSPHSILFIFPLLFNGN